MTAEELQAIRARVDERCDAIATTQDPGLRGFFAITDIRALLAHVDAFGISYDRTQCPNCGLVWPNPTPPATRARRTR
jgi:hypothetical protein